MEAQKSSMLCLSSCSKLGDGASVFTPGYPTAESESGISGRVGSGDGGGTRDRMFRDTQGGVEAENLELDGTSQICHLSPHTVEQRRQEYLMGHQFMALGQQSWLRPWTSSLPEPINQRLIQSN